jgi:hypothetical protein
VGTVPVTVQGGSAAAAPATTCSFPPPSGTAAALTRELKGTRQGTSSRCTMVNFLVLYPRLSQRRLPNARHLRRWDLARASHDSPVEASWTSSLRVLCSTTRSSRPRPPARARRSERAACALRRLGRRAHPVMRPHPRLAGLALRFSVSTRALCVANGLLPPRPLARARMRCICARPCSSCRRLAHYPASPQSSSTPPTWTRPRTRLARAALRLQTLTK